MPYLRHGFLQHRYEVNGEEGTGGTVPENTKHVTKSHVLPPNVNVTSVGAACADTWTGGFLRVPLGVQGSRLTLDIHGLQQQLIVEVTLQCHFANQHNQLLPLPQQLPPSQTTT